MNEAGRKHWEKITSDPKFLESVAMAKELLQPDPNEKFEFDVNPEEVVDILGRLMDVEDEIQGCKECFPDAWCWNHLERHGELNSDLRIAMGRPRGK